MKNLKIISILALIVSVISMIWGIGVVTYYVDNLFVRALSVAILNISAILVSNTVRLVFKEAK
ncbi:hypothetical protein [Tepidibacter mesophilus]|uniref:hypothetical protein n=1 Tax=Tepidibacter mesophilus TaxID=655607 RepID=UPI000C08CC2A|nr:hypothetical protein [Tepidibacter mesophilus]